LDELARVFARVALDRLMKESAAREPRQESGDGDSVSRPASTTTPDIAGVETPG
jgi:hypothetical protein